jgi:hypothetical protein
MEKFHALKQYLLKFLDFFFRNALKFDCMLKRSRAVDNRPPLKESILFQ